MTEEENERINTEAKEYDESLWNRIKGRPDHEIISRLRWSLRKLHKNKATEESKLLSDIESLKNQIRK